MEKVRKGGKYSHAKLANLIYYSIGLSKLISFLKVVLYFLRFTMFCKKTLQLYPFYKIFSYLCQNKNFVHYAMSPLYKPPMLSQTTLSNRSFLHWTPMHYISQSILCMRFPLWELNSDLRMMCNKSNISYGLHVQ